MTRTRSPLLVLALAVVALVTGCDGRAQRPPPSIVAQGFDLTNAQESTLGAFSTVRLRFEAPAGIEHLVVRERSFEVDLAKSPEASHFALFGLERRVWSKRDVTLDFSGYLNSKLDRPGDYALAVELVDREARSVGATLRIVVAAEPNEAPPDEPTAREAPDEEPGTASETPGAPPAPPSDSARLGDERPFRLQRVGAGSVAGGEPFGITWKTVEAVEVVIRVTPRADEPARLARLDSADYDTLETRVDLGRALERVELAETLEIPTANGAASGAVLAVVRPDEQLVLRTDHSTTSLSELGTTVTLSGRYRAAPAAH